MMRGRLLFVLWCSNIMAVAHIITVGGNRCTSDLTKTITCAWHFSDGVVVESKNYSLKFTTLDPRRTVFSCPVLQTDQGFSCSCVVLSDCFTAYKIKLCNESECEDFLEHFQPHHNIKLTPPPELEFNVNQSDRTIICQSEKYKGHLYIKDFLFYEVVLQESQSDTKQIINLNSMKNVWNDSESQLKPNTEYCIKARFKASSRLLGLESSWSEWSKSICRKNEDKEEQRFLLPILLKTLGPVCLTLGVLLFAFYNPATRMKIKTLAHTPTPAPFFKPLFQQHEGNLQEWLSPHGKQVLTYKTEEDLIPDVVTVLPKSSSKDFEENQDFLSLPTTQLVFPLSHTSYVGLPGMDNAFPPATLLCPGDTPYTQFPGSSLGFNFQEKEVFSSGMKDTLEISHCDSGCSCEDLTQSLECSLPCSPVDETPTPNHCNDYCILNKTAEGIIPILLAKQRARDVRSDSLKSEG